MGFTTISFILLSLMAVGGAVLMLMSKGMVQIILWLIVVFIAITGHYLLLNAQFLAIVNLIVYAGAIMVLFMFVVMTMNLNTDSEPAKNHRLQFIGVISGGSLLLVLLSAFINVKQSHSVMLAGGNAGLIKVLGKTLFTDYVLPFEISSVLFLSAIIGAVVIGTKTKS